MRNGFIFSPDGWSRNEKGAARGLRTTPFSALALSADKWLKVFVE
jgi:hypothetical protein